MRWAGLFLIGVWASLLSGCAAAQVSSAPYSRSSYPPTDPASVHILRSFPDSGYVKIGEVSAEMPLTFKETDATFEAKVRAEVARMGGDAVVVQQDEPFKQKRTQTRWETDTYKDDKGHVRSSGSVDEPKDDEYGRKFYGVAIKFTQQ